MLLQNENNLSLLPPEILTMIIAKLSIKNINNLRLVCRRLKNVTEMPIVIRSTKSKAWQLEAGLPGLRSHFVLKLALSFAQTPNLEDIPYILMVWARKIEEKLFVKAKSRQHYSFLVVAKLARLINAYVKRERRD